MLDRFEEIFAEVMEEMDADWYEVFDGEGMAIVDTRIEAEFGADVFDSDEYQDWYDEMAEDL